MCLCLARRRQGNSIMPRKLFKLVATREFSAFYLFYLNEIVRKNCSNFRKPTDRENCIKIFCSTMVAAPCTRLTYSLNRISETDFVEIIREQFSNNLRNVNLLESNKFNSFRFHLMIFNTRAHPNAHTQEAKKYSIPHFSLSMMRRHSVGAV